jgi:hypothetical protein
VTNHTERHGRGFKVKPQAVIGAYRDKTKPEYGIYANIFLEMPGHGHAGDNPGGGYVCAALRSYRCRHRDFWDSGRSPSACWKRMQKGVYKRELGDTMQWVYHAVVVGLP